MVISLDSNAFSLSKAISLIVSFIEGFSTLALFSIAVKTIYFFGSNDICIIASMFLFTCDGEMRDNGNLLGKFSDEYERLYPSMLAPLSNVTISLNLTSGYHCLC